MDTLSGLSNEAHTGICCAHQQKAEPQEQALPAFPPVAWWSVHTLLGLVRTTQEAAV